MPFWQGGGDPQPSGGALWKERGKTLILEIYVEMISTDLNSVFSLLTF